MPPTTLTPPTTVAPAAGAHHAAAVVPAAARPARARPQRQRLPGAGRRRSPTRSTPRRASSSPSTASPSASHNPDLPLIPASNQKLLVGAVALDVLGADHTFTTEVRAATPPSGGVIAGDLYLVGGGDPLLTSSTTIRRLQHHHPPGRPARRRSTRSPTRSWPPASPQSHGGVVGDGSRYDDEFFAADRGATTSAASRPGRIDALLVNDARVTGEPHWQVADDPTSAPADAS